MFLNRFKGKVAFISGASSGIGKDIAISFAKTQACLVLNGRNKKKLEETAQECIEAGRLTEDQVNYARFTTQQDWTRCNLTYFVCYLLYF